MRPRVPAAVPVVLASLALAAPASAAQDALRMYRVTVDEKSARR